MSKITPTLDLERDLASQGYDLIVGFDEVGRGALAGPVMVGCAAIWARDLVSSGAGLEVPAGVADSKMLTEYRREAIYDELCDWCAAWAVGEASNTEIDDWGISYALGIAALRALNQVERQLGLEDSRLPSGGELSPRATEERPPLQRPLRVGAILDGPSDYITKALGTFDAPDVPVSATVTTKVKGDQHCATVATAAVIAKVTRDRLMMDLARSNPQYAPYEWEHNKGYGSAAHRAAIAEHGPTPLHRISWHLT